MSSYLLSEPSITDLEKKGFLILKVSPELVECIQEIFRYAAIFYQKTDKEKQVQSLPAFHEGWQPLGGEFSITPEMPDLHESFWVTLKNKELAENQYQGIAMLLHQSMCRCMTMYNEIERSLTKMLMEHYGNGDNTYPFNCGYDSDMQILYYQPSIHKRTLLQEPHDDSLYMTFAKATAPGLEIEVNNEKFIRPVLADNEILVMPGEIMALMTGYAIKPLIHQVVRHPMQQRRFSLGYFLMPDIKPTQFIKPWIQNESNAGIDIMERVIYNQNQYLVKQENSSNKK